MRVLSVGRSRDMRSDMTGHPDLTRGLRRERVDGPTLAPKPG
ncbi:hypothetical protein [Intrasporangium sp.]|nr:hypothetical protein [Intrasporangium sp.]